jgi:hypothetical protein
MFRPIIDPAVRWIHEEDTHRQKNIAWVSINRDHVYKYEHNLCTFEVELHSGRYIIVVLEIGQVHIGIFIMFGGDRCINTVNLSPHTYLRICRYVR